MAEKMVERSVVHLAEKSAERRAVTTVVRLVEQSVDLTAGCSVENWAD